MVAVWVAGRDAAEGSWKDATMAVERAVWLDGFWAFSRAVKLVHESAGMRVSYSVERTAALMGCEVAVD